MVSKLLAVPGVLAAASLMAPPAVATTLPPRAAAPIHASSQYGPSIGIGWGGAWVRGGGWRHRHHRSSTAGDILTGVLILGTIAAVASAANRANERRGYPYPNRERGVDWRDRSPRGLDAAADLCLREIERNARVREVTGVERDAGGWLVSGVMADGAGFTCAIGEDGRIADIRVGGAQARFDGPDLQYDDARYRSARAAADAGTLPAYPGGPLPGETRED